MSGSSQGNLPNINDDDHVKEMQKQADQAVKQVNEHHAEVQKHLGDHQNLIKLQSKAIYLLLFVLAVMHYIGDRKPTQIIQPCDEHIDCNCTETKPFYVVCKKLIDENKGLQDDLEQIKFERDKCKGDKKIL